MSKMTPPLETEASRRAETGQNRRETAKSEQPGKSEKLASWHPVPIRLVDKVMPRLKDTELRVILVVLRQTWGWKTDRMNAGSQESTSQQANNKQVSDKQTPHKQPAKQQATKRRDWLSHRQLCRRTGRGSDAVSAAVASLTASGLIIVEDASGKPLTTPEERRRCLGRLYFRPGTLWLE